MNEDSKTILLLAEARSDDGTGMEELAARVRERLYPYVIRNTMNPDMADDVLQETLVAMIARLRSLRNPTRFWPWIYRVAWNKIQDAFRQHRTRPSVRNCRTCAGDARGDYPSALEAQVHQETLRQVSQAVDELNAHHQEVVRLRCFEQLEYAEIASRTQTTPESVRIRYHRAKQSLKARLVSLCG